MLSNLWNREPALVLGFVNAALALAIGFGLSVSPSQVGLINAFVATLLALITRSQVTPISGATAPPSIDMTRRLGIALLAAVLAGGVGCASARHAAVVADATLSAAVFAIDDAEFAACQSGMLTPAQCAQLNEPIKRALKDVKALTLALQATPATGTVPKSMPDLMKDLQIVNDVMAALGKGPDLKPLVDKVQAAQNRAIDQLAKLTGGQ